MHIVTLATSTTRLACKGRNATLYQVRLAIRLFTSTMRSSRPVIVAGFICHSGSVPIRNKIVVERYAEGLHYSLIAVSELRSVEVRSAWTRGVAEWQPVIDVGKGTSPPQRPHNPSHSLILSASTPSVEFTLTSVTTPNASSPKFPFAAKCSEKSLSSRTRASSLVVGSADAS